MARRSPSLKALDTGAAPAAGKAALTAGAAPAANDDTGGTTTQRIVDAVTQAIVERRLMPGTKLAEQQIADIFKVSRTVVRQALNQLSRDRLVALEPARGAFVREPSVEEARQVFEVRQMLEAEMVKRLCAVITDTQVAELRAHLQAEGEAVARTDVPGRTRLLADFHVVLARMLGNEVLAQMLSDLLSRSSLISLMYQSAHSAEHSQDEHVAIVDALERRDARAALKLMQSHLGNVERNLRLNPRSNDLAKALQPLA
ncbi:MAG TPA: GntR family transcriptional regulator [Ideonella sp.]|nr:GntR family transcriptional regulator [Ideonella sp.]